MTTQDFKKHIERQKSAQNHVSKKLNYEELIKNAKMPVYKGSSYLQSHLGKMDQEQAEMNKLKDMTYSAATSHLHTKIKDMELLW